MSSKTALVLIAQGTEEIEFVVIYDTLVRAGIKPTSALVGPSAPVVKCSRGVAIIPDTELDKLGDTASFDVLVIPGGAAGADTISNDATVQKLVRDYIGSGKIVGMICAGTLTALTSGLPRQPITSHPSVQNQLDQRTSVHSTEPLGPTARKVMIGSIDFEYANENVVVSGGLVTSRGPGTSFVFVLQLIELLAGKAKRDEVEGPMMLVA